MSASPREELERVARKLWGEPNRTLSRKGKLRFGHNGSKSVDLATLEWFDHELKEGGGLAGLCKLAGEPITDTGSDSIVAIYSYRDERGTELFQVVRKIPKKFVQRHADTAAPDGWAWNIKGVRRVPYRLPELLAADAALPVFIPEGEKDVETLRAKGLVATCNAGGAGKWLAAYSEHLQGRDAVILPDNDQAGRDHAADVRKKLQGIARSIQILALPDLAEKGDVSDWLAAGGTADALVALIQPQPSGDGATPEPPDISILRLNRRAPPPFPLAIFGAEWMGWIKRAAEAACCPVDYVAAPLLATASALIGNARWSQAWHGWEEPPNLWIASVGDSGDGKSPGTVALFRHALPELERRAIGDYPDRLREWETNAEVAKQRLADWQQEVAKASKKGDARKAPIPPRPADADPGPAPQEPRLKLNDVTIEKVGMLLAAAAPKGLLMVRDELAGFLLGMNVYNDAARAFWLESWNGNAYRVDRMKNAEPIKIPRLAVSWFGTIQPERLAELMEEPDDGLLARFLYCWPDPIPFNRSHAVHDLEFVVRALDRLRLLDMHLNSDGTLAPILMPLQAAALPRLIAFANDMQRRRDLAAGLLRSSYGKARGVALRMALVLQLLWWCGADGYEPPPTAISDAALEAATLWVGDYAIPMAERTFGDAACSQSDRNITTLARWIAQERPSEVHVRTMQREVRLAGLRDAETIHAACGGLVDAGWLLRAAGGFQVRGVLAAAYPINPALWKALP